MSPVTKGAITGALFVTALIAVALIIGPKWSFLIVLIAFGAAIGALFGGKS